MILFFLFANLSYEAQINQLKINKSVIFNLVLKNQLDNSPLLLFPPVHTIKSTFFFKNIYYSYSSSQFLETFSRKSIYLTESIFKNLLNSIVSSESYNDPEYDERSFYQSPDYETKGRMVTFRRCFFFDISSLNNNNHPALYSTSQIFRVYSCSFRNCENNENGGAIQVDGPYFLLVNDCDFISCRSNNNGGAFYCENSNLIVFRNSFQFCSATNIGGAFMYINTNSAYTWDLIIQSNLFTNCQARNYNYFSAQFYQDYNNTCYLYFNKFRCLEKENSSYYTITTQFGVKANYSKFRNAYGDDNYNVHLSPTRTFSPTPSQSPTPVFTPSSFFSPSQYFTSSQPFTSSSPFTQSNRFTSSSKFTPSLSFSSSDTYTASSPFTPSNELIPVPTKTISASRSLLPSLTQSPFDTPAATPSISYTPTFSPSQSFTPKETPSASETPTLSKTPCITWPKLSLGLLILAGIILLLGIIANIYLIMLCCKPSEIFVQQVL